MKNHKLNKIFSYVKGKKNSGISDDLLPRYFDNNYFKDLFKKDLKIILKNRKFKDKIKEVRKELYKIHGVFQVKRQNQKNILLGRLKDAKDLNEIKEISKEILKLHSSTRERLNVYEKVYSSIFKIIGKPESIMDLGCGLNPVFFILIDFKGTCIGYDISSNDVTFLNNYFKGVKRYGVNGKAFVKDVKKFYNYPKSDVCLLLKTLDLFGSNKLKFFNNLIKNINTKYLVVSFSKKTISLKNMNNFRRK
jgi:16S rRNA (guanine(1405)-N(7))-methyltransferase